MAVNPIVDSRDVRFVLFEMLETENLGKKYDEYADFDRDIYEEILELAERIAVEKIYPSNTEGDKEGCHYDPDTCGVKIPPSFSEPIGAFYEAGFLALGESPEIGGMGMPQSITQACNEMFMAGSVPMMMYPGLGHGAMMLIHNYGTEEQKAVYAEKMLIGQWGGTMCLTEPEAGSDVGALKAKAVPQDDGSYLITGQKIFITAGENDYYENIIHPVLARIEGDPAGTKGISIFLVPKYRVNEDGSLGEKNDVVCAGIEHKMGIKGSATCTLSFGEDNQCKGYLLGEERKGMKIMFQMMNEARLGVGVQGLALSTSAYMHAVTYAKNRVQGVHISQMMNPEAKAVPIIEHPDVKRMLLWMKSNVEGMRMLSYFLAECLTLEEHDDGEEGKKARAIADFLLPICKAGNTDGAVEVTSESMQVYGGSGYCSDYPVEQLMRDSKITTIYEGTNGIQALDLMMRKLLMNKEQYNFSVFKERVEATMAAAKGKVDDRYISTLKRALKIIDDVVEKKKELLGAMKFLQIVMNAKPFLDAMFILVMGWLHLWSLTIVEPKMKELIGDLKGEELDSLLEDNLEAAFYRGRVLSAQYYLGSELPKVFGMGEGILNVETSVLKANSHIFSGAPAE